MVSQTKSVIFCKNHTALKILHVSWKTNYEWSGRAFFIHDINHSTCHKPSVNFNFEKLIPDKQGKLTILIIVTGRKSCCSRQNLSTQQCRPTSCFFQKTKPRTRGIRARYNFNFSGETLNAHLPQMQKRRRKPVSKKSNVIQEINTLCDLYNLSDVW